MLGVFETIIDISPDLAVDSLDYIFEKIQLIPIKKYNEQVLNFVKDFTTNAFKVYKNSMSSELIEISSDEEDNKQQEYLLDNAKAAVESDAYSASDAVPEYGLPIIYEIMKQNSELGALALKAFLELLKHRCCDNLRMGYLLRCIKNLTTRSAVYQSLTTIITILPKCYSSKKYQNRLKIQLAVAKLQQDFDLIALTIDNIEAYNTLVQKQMVDSVNKGIVPENIPKTCFDGNVTHSDQLEKRLEFIEFVIQYSLGEVQLGTENLKKLWEIFVTRAVFEFDKNLFLKWLNKEKFSKTASQTKEHRKIFTSEEREHLFESILCNPEIVSTKEMTYSCFKCFEKYFGFYNKENDFVHHFKGYYTVYQFENIKGLETLWGIAIRSQDEKVREDSSLLLCTLYLNLHENYYDIDKKFGIWRQFVEQCLRYLDKNNERTTINSAIMLLIKFFDVYDGRNINSSEMSVSSSFPIHIYCQDDNSK